MSEDAVKDEKIKNLQEHLYQLGREVLMEKQRADAAEARAGRLLEAVQVVLRIEKTRAEFPAGGQAAFAATPGEWAEVVRAAIAAKEGT